MPRTCAAFFLFPWHWASAAMMASRSMSSRFWTPPLLQPRRQLHFRRQFFHGDLVLAREHDRVFHGVLQFAHIPGPGVIHQFLKRFRTDDRFVFAELLRETPQESGDERRDIFLAFAQRRDLDLKSIEPVI